MKKPPVTVPQTERPGDVCPEVPARADSDHLRRLSDRGNATSPQEPQHSASKSPSESARSRPHWRIESP